MTERKYTLDDVRKAFEAARLRASRPVVHETCAPYAFETWQDYVKTLEPEPEADGWIPYEHGEYKQETQLEICEQWANKLEQRILKKITDGIDISSLQIYVQKCLAVERRQIKAELAQLIRSFRK